MEVYKLYWSGPFDAKEIKEKKHIAKEFELTDPLEIASKMDEIDWGIYQIYGTHPIHGANTLLYIGIAEKRSFADRIGDHLRNWIPYEADICQIYIGRFFSEIERLTISNSEWRTRIYETEKLLIHFCTPPYNSQNIQNLTNTLDFVLLNYGKNKSLPFVLSTEWLKSFPENSLIPYYSYDQNR